MNQADGEFPLPDTLALPPEQRTLPMLNDGLKWVRFVSALTKGNGVALPDDVVMECLRHCGMYMVPKDHVLCKQGDVGNEFFIVYSGEIGLYIDPAAAKGKKGKSRRRARKKEVAKGEEEGEGDEEEEDPLVLVKHIRAGGSFGEVAMITEDSKRSLTCMATKDTRVIVVQRAAYHQSIGQFHKQEIDKLVAFIRSTLPLFQAWEAKRLRNFALNLVEKTYPPKTVLYRQGDPATHLYFLKEGSCVLRYSDEPFGNYHDELGAMRHRVEQHEEAASKRKEQNKDLSRSRHVTPWRSPRSLASAQSAWAQARAKRKKKDKGDHEWRELTPAQDRSMVELDAAQGHNMQRGQLELGTKRQFRLRLRQSDEGRIVRIQLKLTPQQLHVPHAATFFVGQQDNYFPSAAEHSWAPRLGKTARDELLQTVTLYPGEFSLDKGPLYITVVSFSKQPHRAPVRYELSHASFPVHGGGGGGGSTHGLASNSIELSTLQAPDFFGLTDVLDQSNTSTSLDANGQPLPRRSCNIVTATTVRVFELEARHFFLHVRGKVHSEISDYEAGKKSYRLAVLASKVLFQQSMRDMRRGGAGSPGRGHGTMQQLVQQARLEAASSMKKAAAAGAGAGGSRHGGEGETEEERSLHEAREVKQMAQLRDSIASQRERAASPMASLHAAHSLLHPAILPPLGSFSGNSPPPAGGTGGRRSSPTATISSLLRALASTRRQRRHSVDSEEGSEDEDEHPQASRPRKPRSMMMHSRLNSLSPEHDKIDALKKYYASIGKLASYKSNPALPSKPTTADASPSLSLSLSAPGGLGSSGLLLGAGPANPPPPPPVVAVHTPLGGVSGRRPFSRTPDTGHHTNNAGKAGDAANAGKHSGDGRGGGGSRLSVSRSAGALHGGRREGSEGQKKHMSRRGSAVLEAARAEDDELFYLPYRRSTRLRNAGTASLYGDGKLRSSQPPPEATLNENYTKKNLSRTAFWLETQFGLRTPFQKHILQGILEARSKTQLAAEQLKEDPFAQELVDRTRHTFFNFAEEHESDERLVGLAHALLKMDAKGKVMKQEDEAREFQPVLSTIPSLLFSQVPDEQAQVFVRPLPQSSPARLPFLPKPAPPPMDQGGDPKSLIFGLTEAHVDDGAEAEAAEKKEEEEEQRGDKVLLELPEEEAAAVRGATRTQHGKFHYLGQRFQVHTVYSQRALPPAAPAPAKRPAQLASAAQRVSDEQASIEAALERKRGHMTLGQKRQQTRWEVAHARALQRGGALAGMGGRRAVRLAVSKSKFLKGKRDMHQALLIRQKQGLLARAAERKRRRAHDAEERAQRVQEMEEERRSIELLEEQQRLEAEKEQASEQKEDMQEAVVQEQAPDEKVEAAEAPAKTVEEAAEKAEEAVEAEAGAKAVAVHVQNVEKPTLDGDSSSQP